MQIIHRIVFSTGQDSQQIRVLNEFNIKYSADPLPSAVPTTDPLMLVMIELSEDHPHWNQMRDLVAQWSAADLVRTEFTPAELRQATMLAMLANWYHGYPMPDNHGRYLEVTYGGSGCDECGIGHSQTAPFCMRGEPKWGRRQIMKLHWVTDEFFVTPEAHARVFASFGIECREVLHHKTRRPLETVVQLCIPHTEARLNVENFDEVCEKCGAGKYHWPTRGRFPKLQQVEHRAMFKTREYFGSGGAAGGATIVSAELFRAIEQSGMKGCCFEPMEN